MKQIALRLDDDMAEAIDKASAGMPRERWIKQALGAALSGSASVPVPSAERGTEPASARSPQVERARQTASSRVSARPTLDQVSATTGHHAGCGCIRCDDVRTGRKPIA